MERLKKVKGMRDNIWEMSKRSLTFLYVWAAGWRAGTSSSIFYLDQKSIIERLKCT